MEIHKKIVLTENQKRKQKERANFNIDPVKDFITDKNRETFGHICDKCNQKFRCHKWKNAIIIICDKFEEKI